MMNATTGKIRFGVVGTNFISDWVTQNKVKTLAAIVGNQRDFVINLLEQIGKEYEDTLKAIQEKETIKDRWLTA